MPNRKKRARRREGGAGAILPALIVIVSLAAIALMVVLFYSNPLSVERSNSLPYHYGDLNFTEPSDATAAPLVLGTTATPEPTEDVSSGALEPTATPDAVPNDVEIDGENGENRLIPTPMPGDYFLPIFDKALRTPDDRPMIAITVDGCDDVDALTKILNVAQYYDVKLTLFPSGDSLMKLASGFRSCVGTFHYEIENCAYDPTKRDYTLSSGEMALQIWRQSIATSYAITRDYQQHFYRPRTKESVYDQRTHFFIRKLGFLGIASYTHSYRDHTLDSLVSSLENGNIYQFDMSDKSMEMFETFISEASRKGYAMVTMNDLFGLEENTISNVLTINQQTLPEMTDYVPTYYDLKLNYRTNAVYSLQGRLMNLGYLMPTLENMNVKADGIYGSDTSVAVSAFQARVGIVATGNADVETQQKLFSADAPHA